MPPGLLSVRNDCTYSFMSSIGAQRDIYRFYSTDTRDALGEASTRVGSLIPGKPFSTYITGRRSLNETGHPAGGAR